jgi:WD40 repeat protein
VKNFLCFCLLSATLFAVDTLIPFATIDINGTVKDMVLNQNKLVIATDMGHVEVYDVDSRKKIKEISIPDIKDFMGDIMPARVMSTDVIAEQYLLLSDSGKGGYSDLYLFKEGKISKLIGSEDKEAIIKARFVDDRHILLGYLSDEVALLDIESKKELYRTQLSESKFSDFMLNEKHTQAVFSCESGVLSVVDVKSGKVIEELQGQNVDNVYKVDFKAGTVSGAGQDRRGSLYDVKTKKGTYIVGEFLIYATALSPTAEKVAFAMDEKNNISIYNRSSKSKIALLKGQKSTLNVIIFQDENRLFSASDDNTIMVWDLNKK